MRTTEVFQRLENARLKAAWDHLPRQGQLRRLDDFRTRYQQLREIPGFEQFYTRIDDSIIFRSRKDALDIPPEEWTLINTAYVPLIAQLTGLHTYLSTIVGAENQNSVFIKLPNIKDVTSITQMMERFDAAISQVILHPKIGGTVELKSWEKGSFWFELYLTASAATLIVGKMVWVALLLQREYLKNKLFKEQLNSLTALQEHKAAIVAAQDEQLKLLLESQARAIFVEFYDQEVDHEQIERLKRSIKEISALIESGSEVHPSLLAPSELKDVFPSFSAPELMTSKTTLLDFTKDQGGTPQPPAPR